MVQNSWHDDMHGEKWQISKTLDWLDSDDTHDNTCHERYEDHMVTQIKKSEHGYIVDIDLDTMVLDGMIMWQI